MAKPAAKKKTEAEKLAESKEARTIAVSLFGELADVYATSEIRGYLREATRAAFLHDLDVAIADAKHVYETDKPTPEMVFDQFEDRFIDE